MATEMELRGRLGGVFPAPQADVLAEILHETREAQVTREDFHELKAAVQELAGAQTRTERRVEELAGAVQELAEAQQNTERALGDLARQVGGLAEAVGANLEDLACSLVPELLEKHWGMVTTSAGPEELRTNGAEYPFDLVVRWTVEGRPVVVLGEVKSNLSLRQAERFLRLVELVRPGLAAAEVRAVCFGHRAERPARELLKARAAAMIFSRGVMI